MRADRDTETQIHQRLLSGDPTAPADLANRFLQPLVKSLSTKYHLQDETLITDAAVDAIINYSKNPPSYSPSKSGLSTFLYMSAEGDLINSLDSRKRRRKKEIQSDFVEQREDDRNKETRGIPPPTSSDPTPLQILVAGDLMDKVNIEFADSRDQKLASLVIHGERDTEAYAEVLGITEYPEQKKRKMVKQHRDRINKRLLRLGKRLKKNDSH